MRAGIAVDLPDSDHTSIKQRLESVADTSDEENLWEGEILRPIARVAPLDELPFTLHNYIDLVDWTGRQVRNDERGAIDAASPAVLNRLGARAHGPRCAMAFTLQVWSP